MILFSWIIANPVVVNQTIVTEFTYDIANITIFDAMWGIYIPAVFRTGVGWQVCYR